MRGPLNPIGHSRGNWFMSLWVRVWTVRVESSIILLANALLEESCGEIAPGADPVRCRINGGEPEPILKRRRKWTERN